MPDQENPIPAKASILVIFGIAGDLTKRLLYPAICNLGAQGLLDENFQIVGLALEDYTTRTFRTKITKDVRQFITDPATKKFGIGLRNRVHYIAGNFSDPKLYSKLKNKLDRLQAYSKNYLFYFAVPPHFIQTIATGLSQVKLLTEKKDHYFRHLIIEKPFGHDLSSAKLLNLSLLALVREHQLFRIDHFLGKETVQNLLAFRFSNSIFEPLWNHHYIDHVQITLAETLGVETRGAYYEKAGALRDMVPNHLLQLLSLLTMEAPNAFSAKAIRAEKTKVLNAISPLTPTEVLKQVVRGQYGPNAEVPGYRSEKNIDPQSSSETYVALKLFIDNWRWSKVPFYLRTGKRMKARASEIIIQFKATPTDLFNGATPNLLRIYIQPDEGISLQFNAKIPGSSSQLAPVEMKFKYQDYFGITPHTGYETILYDCMNSDHLLFNHTDMIETGWALVQPILDVWAASPAEDFPNYPAGTWGPKAADDLLTEDGRKWLL